MQNTTSTLAGKLAATAAAGASAVLVLAGCAGGGAQGDSGDDALNVVATTTQVQNFTRVIGDDNIELTGLLKPGASAHHFDPSPSDLAALKKADVLVINGANLEEFLDSAVKSSGFDGTIIDASRGVKIDGHSAATLAEDAEHEEHGHGDDDADHEDDGHEDDGHDHDHEHGDHEHDDHEHDEDHHHHGFNPHIWTSPENAKGMVGEIARGLEKADSDNADDYKSNAAAYEKKLDELDSWIGKQMSNVAERDRQFVSSHDAMKYYLDAYDINYVGSVIPSFEDNAEPSAAQLNELISELKEHRVKAVFVESSVSPKLSKTVAKETHAKIVDDPIYADSLAKDGAAKTYIGATVANTETILKAWGVTPESVPSSLK
jgi:ABC-type Zn uptake system ZnuABC Zn-binding protein ZnuA